MASPSSSFASSSLLRFLLVASAAACAPSPPEETARPTPEAASTGEEQRTVGPSSHLFAGLYLPSSGAALDATAYEKLASKGIVRQTYRSFAATEEAIDKDLSALWGLGATPQLYVEPTVIQKLAGGGQYTRRATSAETVLGTKKFVSAITGWLKSDPARRLYLTFGAEANGGWTPYGCWYAEDPNPAVVAVDGFVATWRRFHDELRVSLAAEGLDSRRVRWVYGPDRQGGGRRQKDTGSGLVFEAESGKCPPTNDLVRADYKEPYRSYWGKHARWQKLPGAAYYWPGSAYVDYVGMSAYRTWERQDQLHWETADALVRDSKELLGAVGLTEDTWAGRAIVLQTGSPDPVKAGKDGGSRDAWIQNAFAAAASDPARAVAGIIYFSLDKKESGTPDYANDWSVNPQSGLPALLDALSTYGQRSAVDTTFDRFYWDVSVSHPYYPEIQLLGEKAWASSQGKSAGGCAKEPAKFCPDRAVTRAEANAMVERLFGKAPPVALGEDLSLAALSATLSSLLGGTPLPQAPVLAGPAISRAEAAAFIARAYRATALAAPSGGPPAPDKLGGEQPPPEDNVVDVPHDDGPSGDAEGVPVAETGAPASWTCDPTVFGDGTCDCACGAPDFDCDQGECGP